MSSFFNFMVSHIKVKIKAIDATLPNDVLFARLFFFFFFFNVIDFRWS